MVDELLMLGEHLLCSRTFIDIVRVWRANSDTVTDTVRMNTNSTFDEHVRETVRFAVTLA